MVRVCVVTTAFPRWIGDGDGVFVWEMIRALAQRGLQVCVVAAHSPGVPSHTVMEGIEIFRPRYWWPEKWEMLRKEEGGLPITWKKYPLVRPQIVPFVFFPCLGNDSLCSALFFNSCSLDSLRGSCLFRSLAPSSAYCGNRAG